ncbi:acetyl-CoA synthetase-like protein [Sodiomyces alkalinus F11]|uniref:Acetyl-CoA synthetase-like protein n=1 Tax=Sodiomyces alkalinus (strain CBS 110278 / VKM F-3762 / F11) TaxID=1314773 RepID=A0A3N2PLL1_SODAK|nr:acetyl-CoA synthetase-like protein [Sodiomyces alkalinus F11]ROT35236.1 acetyl-CoA synthetase-like protein [Sodiomyces alkalinus F11]
MLGGAADDIAAVIESRRWNSLLDDAARKDIQSDIPEHPLSEDESSRIGALILHSSGTTGMPKPIHLTQRYVLGYAACHELTPQETGWTNLSTLPLYHGFGLLAPCLSLSVGMTCCFPPASIIPAGRSTVELLRAFGAETLMSVPSIIDDILSLEESEKNDALEILKTLKLIAIGGGALRTDAGEYLAEKKVNLVNHYGVTEIGAIAPIFRPGPDYDWHYLRLRKDLNLHLEPIPDSTDRFKLVGHPIGWKEHFEIQDEMERRPGASRDEVRIIGRTDDVIVLKSGEKVMPRLLESALMTDPAIKTAVCIGSGFFELLVLVEPSSQASETTIEKFREHAWDLIKAINPSLDQHGRISSIEAIIVRPPGKDIPRSDKGSVMRREVMERFKQEIEAAYSELEGGMDENGATIDTSNLTASVQRMVEEVAGGLFSEVVHSLLPEDDFFERGMDSLQSVRLARAINNALKKAIPNSTTRRSLTAEFVYANPSIQSLAAALDRLLKQGGVDTDNGESQTRAANMQRFLVDCIDELRKPTQTKREGSDVVLVTGATGNLGAHVVGQLVRDPRIKKVICLLRESKGKEPKDARLSKTLASAGVTVSSTDFSRIQVEECDPGQWFRSDPEGDECFNNIADEITHILHLAWPMDFHRTLKSFRPQLHAVQGLVRIARAAHHARPGTRVRLFFASSIAVVRHFSDVGGLASRGAKVPEVGMDDPDVTTPMGYAEAKWVCEHMLVQVGRDFGAEVEPVIVRIGQLSGPEWVNGVWKTQEHLPALVRASQLVGALPALQGSISWLPVDRAAKSVGEMLLHSGTVERFLHLENPVRQPMADVCTIMANELGLAAQHMPFDEWLQRADEVGATRSLESFFKNHFRTLASGAVVLDTSKARTISATLRGSGGLPRDLVVEYIKRWRQQGFLQ